MEFSCVVELSMKRCLTKAIEYSQDITLCQLNHINYLYWCCYSKYWVLTTPEANKKKVLNEENERTTVSYI